ncbi:hypothetical protein RRG08_041372 [Elysia crispata]|uniref:Uncharacterized protein n=1 Tax=Elysia crispata TaxID=231223 RepID=A0AAE1B337_9GAST|nr:hypothetical protein RRG08_041372 [Elysia crispata]
MLLIYAAGYNECNVEIRKTFVAAQRECSLDLCPLEGYADGKNNFTVALFESIQFNVCFQSPTGTPPKVLEVIPDAGNDSRTSSTTLRTSEHSRTFRTFQTKVSKKANHTSRYLVEVKAITIQPDDLGLWKISVVDGADKDERNPIFLSFRVYAQGPPQCPLEENSVMAKTFAIHQEVDLKKPNQPPVNVSMLHIIIAVSGAALVFFMIVVIISLIFRKRGNKLTITEEASNAKSNAEWRSHDQEQDGSRQRVDETLIINSVYGFLGDVVSNRDESNPVSGNKLTITEEAINAKSSAEWRSRDQEEDGSRQREDETLIINSVYGLLRDVVSNRDDSNPGQPSYANQISVPNDHS